MTDNPYSRLPEKSFWRSAVANAKQPVPDDLYTRKWAIDKKMKVATAGSCFAQHIGRHLNASGFTIMDVEPAPDRLPADQHINFGYSIYSARYGNIYTLHQMLQLAQEAFGLKKMRSDVWQKGTRFVDPLRPTIEPDGLGSPEIVLAHRTRHLERVRKMLLEMDVFIFTLGLTETWIDGVDGAVLPICPGTVAGSFDDKRYKFKNFSFNEILNDFVELRELLKVERSNKPLRFLVTVSPVPLTATATGGNVQVSTVYSKSVLRAVAGEISDQFENVDYYPSYEIITSPWSGTCFYNANMRSVSKEGVGHAMRTFIAAHDVDSLGKDPEPVAKKTTPQVEKPALEMDAEMMVKCDEELLEAFGKDAK